ncbi:hypothetical protein, partial [Pseudomonas sp. AD21]|uniref:hypothetical protein n=1 Tax=Pseudomonas sp. AD21 TaxID=396378 RepID=UPI001C474FBF
MTVAQDESFQSLKDGTWPYCATSCALVRQKKLFITLHALIGVAYSQVRNFLRSTAQEVAH